MAPIPVGILPRSVLGVTMISFLKETGQSLQVAKC